MYEGTLISLAEYWAQLSASRREVLRQSGWSAELGDGASGVLYAWWNMWGGPALVLVLWIIAVQRDLLLEED
ncbi:MAG: hypothetical protein VX293_01760 [Candidatus Latescibacterota bacterium]|nr:hypothetical protein [Candidatus Latescibacterota bacterium]